ncbi:sensor histidine kinase [Stakelama tenebrarum]|uniref:histidine kinase n=1 Tax=Stakelama tenebrarum TaxID=2711215 RepID=A0A6G6Y953_9SPHN|nr:sensor histidine kinase [Sphingosinithalassobacter tenebrarum]QIG81464.1 sensor histidine kinase [Sphingosinithalassobacter tenebrarum]
MARIGELDLPARLAPAVPQVATQIGFGLLCAAAAITFRAVVDLIAPAAGPYALGYVAVLVATLFARWPAGAITAVFTILYSWYFILPVFNSFAFGSPLDGPRTIVNASAYAAIVVVAELFRRAVRWAVAERDREVAERDLFLEEFDHRVKNNFALVASLLDLQRRRADDPATAEALSRAQTRIESIARAHRHLYRGGASVDAVDMQVYLRELCAALSEALFLRATITLTCEADHVRMARDRAVSIGLVVNELVTNAAKHAFVGRDAGNIQVRFRAHGDGWLLEVADNGIGIPEEMQIKGREGGLGQRLVTAFAGQAGGTLSTESDPHGTVTRLTLEA